ncbi:MAG TPA: hypothetical protein VND42_01995 [Candidatus Acidoferrales bacterium]|nr:hypothetical protein [Candidatus Acidoferrales bacterium]
MSRNARLSVRQIATVLIVLFFAGQTVSGYNYPLHSEAIRDAYFLGVRNNFQTTDCLLQYVHRFTGPQTGRYFISQISISTPYQQIVLRGRRQWPGDSEVQTETDLQAHPLKFVLRITVQWTRNAYVHPLLGSAPWPDLARNVSIHVRQGDEITPLKVSYRPIYARRGPSEEIVELEFDPAKITSAPLRVGVHKPDGQVVETEFDLAKLH